MKKIIIVIAVVVIAVVVWLVWSYTGSNGQLKYETVKVDKGDIVKIVTASGVVQPLQQVQVGTQVSGPIKKLYADFNSRVKEGDIIARIDPATYEARVVQNKANLTRSIAEVKRVEANLLQSRKELERAKELAKRELISQSELDSAIASYDSLAAQLEVAEANVEQAQASLKTSEINLDYTIIKSPIDGIVISRNVDEGQTVAASFSAPTLFVIANNLNKIQIEANVAEADIGKIAVGQTVNFSVDAYSEDEFTGKVTQVRLSPNTVQYIVTYIVIINADNPDEKLLPGMTASLSFEVKRYSNVLRVPKAALRFTPPNEEQYKIIQIKGSDMSGIDESAGKSRRQIIKQVWVMDGNKFRPISVIIGQTDSSFSEILKGDINEGQEVVVGVMANDDPSSVNPFRFRIRGGRH